MLKLEKYLLENADTSKQSLTTNSRYYIFNDIKIRISDHYAPNNDSEMQIIMPTNENSYYTVFLKGSKRLLNWRAKQIIEFIPSYIITKKVLAPVRIDEDDDANLIPLEQILGKEIIPSRIDKNALGNVLLQVYNHSKTKWNEHDADTLHFLIQREFGTSKNYNGDFRTFLRSNEISYLEAINLYYYIVIKEGLSPTYKKLKECYESILNLEK